MNSPTEPERPHVDEGFFSGSVARPVGLGMAFLTMLVVGAIAYLRIPVQLLPSGFSEPVLNLFVPNPGSSARENEEKVARPIEEQLRTMAGIEEVYSSSSDGSVWMEVSFDSSLDLDLAKAEVRDRVERARPGLPGTIGQIEFWSEDADQFPISWFGILHKGDSDRTDFLLDAVVKPRLEAVPGVSKIDVFGVLDDSMRILLDEDRVIAAGLDIGELIGRLSTDNFAEPLGEIDDGGRRFLVRSDMRFQSTEDIERYPVGGGLTVGDLGRVIRAKSVRNQLSRIDGDYAYFGVATKESGADVVQASRRLEAAFAELEQDPRLAGQVTFLPFFMQGKLIENSLAQLRNTALWGGGLALVVLGLFLKRLRLTLCVALSIPVSALMAISWEFFGGGSFNLLTMVGITLGIGMLVDNSVVMIENIARSRALGLDGRRAAVVGAREIALAVTLATLTTVVVFMPLIFMSSNPEARVLFGGIGLPLCISLLFSLFVAVVFLPVAAARILGDRPAWAEAVAQRLVPLAMIPGALLAGLVGLLRLAGHHLARVLWGLERALLALLAPSGSLAPLGWLLRGAIAAALVWVGLQAAERAAPDAELLAPVGLAPESPARSALALGIAAGLGLLLLPPLLARRRRGAPRRADRLRPRVGTPLQMIIALQRGVVAWTLEHRIAATCAGFACFASIAVPLSQLDMAAFGQDQSNDSVRYWIRFGSDYTLAEASEQMQIHEDFFAEAKDELGFGHCTTNFSDTGGRITAYWDEPVKPSQREKNRAWVKERAPRPPGHQVRFVDAESAGARSRTIARFELRGPDSRVLDELGAEAVELLEQIPGLSNVASPADDAPQQLRVDIDREVALGMGVTSESAFNSIGWTLRGWPLPRFQDEGREIPFIIEFDTESTAGLGTLRDLSVFSETGNNVPLASFSQIRFEAGSRTIRRVDGRTTLTLTAEVDDPTRTTELNVAGYRALGALDLPRGYELGLDSSAAARGNEEAQTMLRALLLSVVLVFLLMGILFESVVLPFSVLVTIPFAVMGAFWTLWIVGTPMDLLAWIGLIILAGVVVNNGIVLIDCIHRLRPETSTRTEAVIEGAARRVRPILMTALTTIFGLIPMILTEPADDSIDYRGLGTVVAGGLFVATFFTLWVVPLAYTLIDDFARAAGRSAQYAFRRPTRPAETPEAAELSGSL